MQRSTAVESVPEASSPIRLANGMTLTEAEDQINTESNNTSGLDGLELYIWRMYRSSSRSSPDLQVAMYVAEP